MKKKQYTFPIHRMNNLLLPVLLLMFIGQAAAQPVLQWESNYMDMTTTVPHYGRSLVHDQNSYVYSFGDYSTKSFLVKYNLSGVQQWVVNFTPVYNAVKAIQVNDTLLALIGNRYNSASTYYWDFWICLINVNSTIEWEYVYNGPTNHEDFVSDITCDQSGNLYVTGTSGAGGGAFSDITTLKLDINGNLLWSKQYNGSGSKHDSGHSIALDDNLNVYISGTSWSSSTGDNVATLKYKPDGTLSWAKAYNRSGSAADYGAFLQYDNGKVFVSAITAGIPGITNGDQSIVTYDTTGTQLWVQHAHAGNEINVMDMEMDKSGNLLVLSQSDTGMFQGYAVAKFTQGGTIVFMTPVTHPTSSIQQIFPQKMALDTAGNVIITGAGGATIYNIYMGAVSNNGSFMWSYYHLTGTADYYEGGYDAIVETATNNIYLTGCDPGIVYDNSGTIKFCGIIPFCFTPQVNTTTSANSGKGCKGDFNNDGYEDFAQIHSASDQILTYISNGTGAFTLYSTTPVAVLPTALFAGDLNNDGFDDIVAIKSSTPDVYIYINNTLGGFYSPANYTCGNYPRMVAIGDLDADADNDLAIAIDNASQINILTNSGIGTFSIASLTAGNKNISIKIKDLNHDLIPDILAGSAGLSSVYYYKGLGSGAFASFVSSAGGNYEDFDFVDFNLDGNLDIVGYYSTFTTRATGSGTGTFGSSTPGPTSTVAITSMFAYQAYPSNIIRFGYTTDDQLLVHAFKTCGNGFKDAFKVDYGTANPTKQVLLADFNGDINYDIICFTGSIYTAHPYSNCFDEVFVCNTTTHAIFDTICAYDNYMLPGGGIVSASGIYIDTLVTFMNCDSVIETHLTVINPVASFSTSGTLLTSTSVNAANEQWYDCNSNAPLSGETNPTYTPFLTGNYALIAYNNGCSDTSTCQNILVCSIANTIVYDTICPYENYLLPGGGIVSSSGIYFDTLTAINTCDSIIETNLAVTGLSVSFIISGPDLVSTSTGASALQWIICPTNLPLAGGTGAVFTPVLSGNYSLIGMANGCADTAACQFFSVMGINEFDLSKAKVLPNPAHNYFTVETPNEIESIIISDAAGRNIPNIPTLRNSTYDISILSPGIYFITIRYRTETESIHRLLKQ